MTGRGPVHTQKSDMFRTGLSGILNHFQKCLSPLVLGHGRRARAREQESPVLITDDGNGIPIQCVVLAFRLVQQLDGRRKFGWIQNHNVIFRPVTYRLLQIGGNVRLEERDAFR